MFTPIDELERLIDRARPRCDSCGDPLQGDDVFTRYRHRGCTPPSLPPAALEVLAQVDAMRHSDVVRDVS